MDKKTKRADERMKKKVYICAPLGGNVKEKFRKRGFVYKVRVKAGSCSYNDSFLCAMSG